MFIKKIELKNFRNYEFEKIEFSKGLNILVGKNAQGKTNILESIFLTVIGKSSRSNKEKDMIKFDQEQSKVSVLCENNIGNNLVEFYIRKNQKKCVYVNKSPISKMSQLIGRINAIYFSPDELKLIKECPEDRRKFIDVSLCQMSKSYFFKLSNFNKALNERNKLLKQSNISYINKTIGIWNESFAKFCAEVISERIKFVKILEPFVKTAHNYLTNNEEKIQIKYVSVNNGKEDEIDGEIKQFILKRLEENFEKDIKLKYTTVGAHRDDLKILINDKDVRIFGSQGQQRTTALSLKLAELEVFKTYNNDYPILLLDDVLSELDRERQNKLLNFNQDVQTIITTTHIDEMLKLPESKVIKISNGKVVLWLNKINEDNLFLF